MSEPELKPCPFCGSTDLDYGIYLGTLWGFDYVECMNCGGKINAIHKPKLICAEELWNRRANEKHGKWTPKYIRPYEDCIDILTCSECGADYDVSEVSNYCPNCGAKMDKEEL